MDRASDSHQLSKGYWDCLVHRPPAVMQFLYLFPIVLAKVGGYNATRSDERCNGKLIKCEMVIIVCNAHGQKHFAKGTVK